MAYMIVTIDGPAGSGKSKAAAGLAKRLGFEFLDTGAMYRAVAMSLHRAGIAYDSPAIEAHLESVHIHMLPGLVELNGENVTDSIRTPEYASGASKVGQVPCVREFLVRQQRQIAAGRSMVCEGRDQGTIVFPDAACKFFLVASAEERAKRRWKDLVAHGHNASFEEVLALQKERDERDANRAVGPLIPAADAIHLDTSSMSAVEVLDWLEEKVRQRCPRG